MNISKLLLNATLPLMIGGSVGGENKKFNWDLFFLGIKLQLALFLFFGIIYYFLWDDFKFQKKIDPFYYSIVTQTGAGYGDFSPTSTRGKAAAMLHLGASYVFYTPFILAYFDVPR